MDAVAAGELAVAGMSEEMKDEVEVKVGRPKSTVEEAEGIETTAAEEGED